MYIHIVVSTTGKLLDASRERLSNKNDVRYRYWWYYNPMKASLELVTIIAGCGLEVAIFMIGLSSNGSKSFILVGISLEC
jgi:hypothetical protein